MSITCSVCVANYNGMDVIDTCIASIRAQKFAQPVEIIVHDDGSNDGSAAHVRARYPDVRQIESETNVGFCVANNRMAAVAGGEYLLLLNNDAALLPDALAVLWQEAERLKRPAILTLPQYNTETGALLDIGSLLDPFLNPLPNLSPEQCDVGMVMGACLWIPRTLWDELGGFPSWFGSIGEDLFICSRARLAGHPVRAVNRSGYLHSVGASFGGGKATEGKLSTTRRRRALSERNKTFVMLTCYPWPLLVTLFPLHIVLLHLEGLLLALVKMDLTLWREIYSYLLADLWKARRRILELRRNVQAKRVARLRAFIGPVSWVPWKLRMLLRHGVPEVR